MKRPPLWVWALPAAVALGLLMGLRLRPVPLRPPPAPPADTAAGPRRGAAVAPPAAAPPAAEAPEPSLVADTAGWGVDGGVYLPLDGPATGDTLPAAPGEVVSGAAQEADSAAADPAPPAPPPPPRPTEGPAQALGREAAYGRPLVAAVRGGGRLSFYSAWDAPASRTSLVGEWARVGACAGVVRLGYEQVVAGLGAVRGAGDAVEAPPWDVALVVARQHCAAAASRWRSARTPSAEERALLAPLLGGEAPAAVVAEGDAIWAASARRGVVARIVAGRAVERWATQAPEGASMRLLGLWEGDGLWAAVETGGRVLRVWRVPR